MPFPLLAHQAVVLPLKLARPRWFDATALCIGSLAPDLEYLGRDRGPGLLHRWSGLWLTTGITVVLTVLCTAIMAPVLRARFPAAFRGAGNRIEWRRTVSSAVLGVGSHLVLDGMTHQGGWSSRIVPALDRTITLFGSKMPMVRVLQYAATVFFALLTLFFLWKLRRAEVPSMQVATGGRGLLVALTACGAAVGARGARQLVKNGGLYFMEPRLHAIGYVMFAIVCHAFVGLALGCIILRARDGTKRG